MNGPRLQPQNGNGMSSAVVVLRSVTHDSRSGTDIPKTDAQELELECGLPEILARCAFMQFISDPSNYAIGSDRCRTALMSNACRFENSDEWIHRLCRNLPKYSRERIDKEIKRVRAEDTITCNAIRSLGFQSCPPDGCRKPNGFVSDAPAGLYGFMFNRQLPAVMPAVPEIPEEYEVGHREGAYVVSREGVFFVLRPEGKVITWIKLSAPIHVVAQVRDTDGDNWGKELEFADADGTKKRLVLPCSLFTPSGTSFYKQLRRKGARVEVTAQAQRYLAGYLNDCQPSARALAVKRPGWTKDVFVLPDVTYGRSAERVLYQNPRPNDADEFSTRGSLESWKQNVAAPALGNSRAIVSICLGLAGPLLKPLHQEGGGIHFFGASSIGKSSLLSIGASVWGGPTFRKSWNSTRNGFEAVASLHNDTLLPLDELGEADGQIVGAVAYMLGNGTGKSRAGTMREETPSSRFRTLILSTGEKSCRSYTISAGASPNDGEGVRLVDVPADAGMGYGVLENIFGNATSRDAVDALKRAAKENYGHAGRTFVRALANPEWQAKLLAKVQRTQKCFVNSHVPAGADGQVGRVASRFGLLAGAGELGIEMGILPWPDGSAIAGCAKCFDDWLVSRAEPESLEDHHIVSQVRDFILRNGETRFRLIGPSPLAPANPPGTQQQENSNLAGFRLTVGFKTEYLVLPGAYRNEVCAGLDVRTVTKILVAKGFLKTDRYQNPQVEKSLPGLGKKRVYHFNSTLLESVTPQSGEAAARAR